MDPPELIVISSDEEDSYVSTSNRSKHRIPSGQPKERINDQECLEQSTVATMNQAPRPLQASLRSKSTDITSSKKEELTKTKRSTSAPCVKIWDTSTTLCNAKSPSGNTLAKPKIAVKKLIAPVAIMNNPTASVNAPKAMEKPSNTITSVSQMGSLPPQQSSKIIDLEIQGSNITHTKLSNVLKQPPPPTRTSTSIGHPLKPNKFGHPLKLTNSPQAGYGFATTPYQPSGRNVSLASRFPESPQTPTSSAFTAPYQVRSSNIQQLNSRTSARPTIPLSQLDPRLHPQPSTLAEQSQPCRPNPSNPIRYSQMLTPSEYLSRQQSTDLQRRPMNHPPYLPLTTQPPPPPKRKSHPPSSPAPPKRQRIRSPDLDLTATSHPASARARSRPWTSAILADLAESLREHFDFAAFAARHGKTREDVFDVFSVAVHLPLLEYSERGLKRARMREFQQKMREFKVEAHGARKETERGGKVGGEGKGAGGGKEEGEKKKRGRGGEGGKGVLVLRDGIYMMEEE